MRNFFKENTLPHFAEAGVLNGTVYWCGTDSEENFRKKPKPGYDETSITYTFNSHGYRTREFNFQSTDPVTLCLGCSHTMGVGHNVEYCWPSLMADYWPSRTVYNLGQGGSTGDTVVRILANAVNCFANIQEVFILWPHNTRFEIVDHNQRVQYYGNWSITPETMFLYEDEVGEYRYQKNKLIVELLSQIHEFKVIDLPVDHLRSQEFFDLSIYGPARDNHFSRAQQNYIFQELLKIHNEV